MHIEHPTRVTHRYTQRLEAKPEVVFPLLCPVRECEWVAGWDPPLVLSTSGVAEEDCVFTTHDRQGSALWIVTDHDPRAFQLRMYKIVPGLVVTRLDIRLRPDGRRRTSAMVTYSYTALSEAGGRWVADRTAEWYEEFMLEWERELNTYLHSGGGGGRRKAAEGR